LTAGCLNAREVTRKRYVGDPLTGSLQASYEVFTFW
jgi:hypothetical protein